MIMLYDCACDELEFCLSEKLLNVEPFAGYGVSCDDATPGLAPGGSAAGLIQEWNRGLDGTTANGEQPAPKLTEEAAKRNDPPQSLIYVFRATEAGVCEDTEYQA